jgi:hypothetical protein
VPIQRVLNDLANLAIETVLRSIAQTIVDQMLLDRETLSKKEAIPNEIIFTMSPMGQDISRMIAQIPPARVSDQLVPLFQLFRMLQQDITGIRPELTGGGQPSQTYREAKQRKDQALMQLKPQADEQSLFWEQVATNTVKLRARYGSGQIKHHEETAIGFESHVVDLAELSETGWHAEADDGIPMSYTEQSDRLYAILHEAKPEIQQSLSLLDPINLDVNLELLGLPNHHSTYENQKKKTTADIQELLRGQPVPGPDGQMQSSIPADEYDDHQFTAEFIRQWMVSPGGQDKKMQVPQGFENVRLMQEAHQKMSAPPSEPPVKAGLNVSAKMEMLPPAIVNEVLQGAGLSPLPPEAMIPPPQLGTPEAPGAEPAAEQGQPGQAETQENPLPPLPPIPAGEQEPPLGPLPPTVQ